MAIVAFYSKNISQTVTLEFFDGHPWRETAERLDIDHKDFRIESDRENETT
jgi:hypothetical protein